MTKTPNLEIVGEFSKAALTKTFESGFRVRTFWLQFDNSYSKDGETIEKISYPEFQVSGDTVDMLDGFTTGQMVKVTFNPEGRPWQAPGGEKKIIAQNRAWRVESAEVPITANPLSVPVSDIAQEDDMPF